MDACPISFLATKSFFFVLQKPSKNNNLLDSATKIHDIPCPMKYNSVISRIAVKILVYQC